MNSKQKYNPRIHHRRSIRLKGYDYSQQGLYFVTICIKNRACLFGEIINHEMILNAAGVMVDKWYNELGNKFSDIKCHEHIVMPNHFHCIIENTGGMGANRRVCSDDVFSPDDSSSHDTEMGGHIGPPLRHPDNTINHSISDEPILGEPILGEHIGSPLHRVLQWFKTMSTNEYIRNVKNNHWQPFDGKLWQRNYYEHIIRDEKSYLAISQYIINNPLNWNNDSINPKKKNNK
jgi:putative transposase